MSVDKQEPYSAGTESSAPLYIHVHKWVILFFLFCFVVVVVLLPLENR